MSDFKDVVEAISIAISAAKGRQVGGKVTEEDHYSMSRMSLDLKQKAGEIDLQLSRIENFIGTTGEADKNAQSM